MSPSLGIEPFAGKNDVGALGQICTPIEGGVWSDMLKRKTITHA